MYLHQSDIAQTDRIRRLNLINAVTGIKPGNLIGTCDADGKTNLAIISSVVHLGSDPACLGFFMRPVADVRRHTYENILQNGCYTINHIHPFFARQAHYTSAKFDQAVSEFQACALTEEFLHGFPAPFVRESRVKIGMKHLESIPIPSNGTLLVVGQIEHLYLPDDAVDERGYVDLEQTDSMGISGLNAYYTLKKMAEYPYARVSDVPSFNDEKTTPSR